MNDRNKQKSQDYADKAPIIRECKDLPLLCTQCRSLLAFVDAETKSEIRVKSRDLYVFCVDPAEFTISCRSCGKLNSVYRTED